MAGPRRGRRHDAIGQRGRPLTAGVGSGTACHWSPFTSLDDANAPPPRRDGRATSCHGDRCRDRRRKAASTPLGMPESFEQRELGGFAGRTAALPTSRSAVDGPKPASKFLCAKVGSPNRTLYELLSV